MLAPIRVVLAAALLAGSAPCAFASGDVMAVELDHARIVETDRPAGTVIVGNPAIVDVEVLSATRLVLTGKSYGITNLVVLDDKGHPMLDEEVAVQTFEDDTVRVYRQASRETFACAPKCEPTMTIGDDPTSFSQANVQYGMRQGMAQQAAQN